MLKTRKSDIVTVCSSKYSIGTTNAETAITWLGWAETVVEYVLTPADTVAAAGVANSIDDNA
jgi:hypothetical protein